jgi:hypothetical protein
MSAFRSTDPRGAAARGLFPIRPSSLEPREHESECVNALAYDPESAQLTVVFNKRGTYTYFDFPPDEYANFNFAASRGKYFNLYIRDAGYEYEKVG